MTKNTTNVGTNLIRPTCFVTLDPGTIATVLHVEDDPNDALLLKLAFGKAHLPVLLQHVEDGRQAVQYLSGSGLYSDRRLFPFPGLVLLDLKMPCLDGFGVLAWARAQPGMTCLRIIVLSSSDQPEDISRAKALGATNYLVKASSYSEVISAVQEYVESGGGPTACQSEPVTYLEASDGECREVHSPGNSRWGFRHPARVSAMQSRPKAPVSVCLSCTEPVNGGRPG